MTTTNDSVPTNNTVTALSSPIFQDCIGKYVLVRDQNEGVNFGEVKAIDSSGVVLKNAQRIWRIVSNDKSLSWYEGVAQSGLCPKEGIISGVVIEKVIISNNFSLTLVNPNVVDQIKEVKPNDTRV